MKDKDFLRFARPPVFWVTGLLLFTFAMFSFYEDARKVENAVVIAESMDLYLLVGQSNMAGRGKLEENDRMPIAGIYVFDRKNEWINRGEPIHFDKPEAGVGLGFAFARKLREIHPDHSVGLIPCAVGGTSQERWMPGADLYEIALKRAREAMKHGQL